MKPSGSVLRTIAILALAFIGGYLVGLNAPARGRGDHGSLRRPPGPAASRPAPRTASPSAGPRIRFTEELFDFGTVDQGQKVVHVYKFSNVGDAPLEISDVTSSCGCTATILSSRRLAPGQAGEVRAEFDSEKYLDQVQIFLHLFTNDPRRRQATVLLQGKVAAFVRTEPRELDLGLVPEGKPARGTLRIEAVRPGERLRVTGVEASSDALTLGPVRPDPAKPGVAYTVEVSLRGQPPYGMLWDWVRLRTDHPKRKMLEVKVNRTVVPAHQEPSGASSASPTGSASPGGTGSP